MILVIDVGNTNITFGVYESKKLVTTFRMTSRTMRTSDEYGTEILAMLQNNQIDRRKVGGAIIASVVPKVMHALIGAVVRYLHTEPLIVGSGIKTGINIRIDDPKSLGSDCLADCVGAYYTYGGPVLVADFGTATTFNYVNDEGVITCGLITTGIRTAAAALWGETAQLPEVEITKPKSILATGTKTAMQAGLYYNFLGGIERTIRQFRMELDEPFTVVATGGLGRVFKDDTELIDVYDPELIFKGMALIHSRNSHR